MRITAQTSDDAVLGELGDRLARARIRGDLTQRELADEAGLSLATVRRIEAGHAVGSDNLVRVLRALGLAEALDGLAPEPAPSPLELLEREGARRRRVRHPRGGRGRPAPAAPAWRWGDEAGG